MTNPDRPLCAGGAPATPPTKADLTAIQQHRIEAGALHKRVDRAVVDHAVAVGPALVRRLAGEA
jgi:hypothetical protein